MFGSSDPRAEQPATCATCLNPARLAAKRRDVRSPTSTRSRAFEPRLASLDVRERPVGRAQSRRHRRAHRPRTLACSTTRADVASDALRLPSVVAMPPLVTAASGAEPAPLRKLNPRSSSLQLRLPSRPASPDAAAAQIRYLQSQLGASTLPASTDAAGSYSITPSPVEDRQSWLDESSLPYMRDAAETTTPKNGPDLSPRTRTSSLVPSDALSADESPVRTTYARRSSLLPQLGLGTPPDAPPR